MDAPGGSSRMTDMPVMVLPEPDSPTRPTDSPAATVRLTPSTGAHHARSLRSDLGAQAR